MNRGIYHINRYCHGYREIEQTLHDNRSSLLKECWILLITKDNQGVMTNDTRTDYRKHIRTKESMIQRVSKENKKIRRDITRLVRTSQTTMCKWSNTLNYQRFIKYWKGDFFTEICCHNDEAFVHTTVTDKISPWSIIKTATCRFRNARNKIHYCHRISLNLEYKKLNQLSSECYHAIG